MAKKSTKPKVVKRQKPLSISGKIKNWFLTSAWSKFGWLWLIVFITLSAFFLSELLKDNNYKEIFPSSLLLPSYMNVLTATIISTIVWFLPRPKTIGAKTITTLFLALTMVNYNTRLTGVVPIFRAILPLLPKPDNDLALISLIFLLVLLAIGTTLGILTENVQSRQKSKTDQTIITAIAIVIGVIFLSQAQKMANLMGTLTKESSYQSTTELQQASAMHPNPNPDEKPDIYYIVPEDYVGNSVIKSQLNNNNDLFMNQLRSTGFSVNENALSQYPRTGPSVASTLNLGYLNDDLKAFKDNKFQSATLFFNMNRQAEAVKLLKQQGYKYYQVGNYYGAFNKAPLADIDYSSATKLRLFRRNINLRDLSQSQFMESPYFQFTKLPAHWWPFKFQQFSPTDFVRMQLNTLKELANDKQQGGRFIFANILVPHEPYNFNADGSFTDADTTEADSVGKPVKQKYVDQIKFINSQLLDIVNDINSNSKNRSVILLISDEGSHPVIMNQTFLKPLVPDTDNSSNEDSDVGDMSTWSDADLNLKFSILQAVKIPKATGADLESVSTVNAFRIVLNRYFGYSFDYLPYCQLGTKNSKAQWYNYIDVTKRFDKLSTNNCSQFE